MKKTLFIFLIVSSFNFLKAQEKVYVAPLGVQSYSFRNIFKEDPIRAFDLMQEMGFKEIEASGNYMSLEEFKENASQRGMTIPSMGASFEDLAQNPEKIVENAKILGANYVMCAWIPHQNKFTIDDAQKAVKVFNKAGKILKENGITLTYHPHGYEFWPYHHLTLLDYIILKTNPEDVSFEMDIFWVFFGGGDPVTLLKRYPSRWKLMHLKDMKFGTQKDLSGGTSTENDVALGTGELNLPLILKTARQVGIRHYFIEDESDNILQQIPESVNYLRNLKW